ncbi:MAG: type II secretion system F family protein [Candidatus Omnitrophota bacterium]
MRFIYKAKKGLNVTVEGRVEAESREEALAKLSEQRLFPISVLEDNTYVNPQQKAAKKKAAGKKIDPGEILNFTQKLATLIRAKVELLSSLKILYEQAESQSFQEVILEIYNATKEGKTFSQSLERFPHVFSPLFINVIKAGEASGRLDLALEQIEDFLARQESLRNKIIVAITYPSLLLVVGLASIFILINFVVPRLKPIFDSFGDKLPLITKVILGVSSFSSRTWFLLAAAAIFCAAALYSEKGRRVFNGVLTRAKARLPVFNKMIANGELVNFCRAFSLLIRSGVSALRSLEIAALSFDNLKMREDLLKVQREVATGKNISSSMALHTGLPKFFTKMVAVGEESGRLSDVLDEAAASYAQQVEKDIAIVSSLLEPLLILFLGVILGAVVLAILLPTFMISQIVG